MNERQYACTVTQGTANTLTGTDYKGTQCVFEPVRKDLYCMATQQGGAEIMMDKAPTITAAAGMSGNNQPVINQPISYGIDRAAFNQGKNSKYGFSVLEEQITTITAAPRGENAVAYDCRNLTPNYNVSGTLQAKSNGGQSLNYINPVFVEKVAHATDVGWLSSCEDVSPTLLSRMYKDPHLVCYENDPEYIVRRLTPLECSRLQGFPDWWCDGLQYKKPTEEDLRFWREVFETHREIVTGASKPKTDKQIIKWLQEEPNDGAMYKMWGNGIALPCFLYVIEGIKEVLERTSNSNSSTTTSEEN